MSILKRFSISLDNHYFRQQLPGVITHSAPVNQNQTYGFNDCLIPSSGMCNHSPIHTSQFVVDASFLMDKKLVDEAAWAHNRAITPQQVPGSDRNGICDEPSMPESASWTDA